MSNLSMLMYIFCFVCHVATCKHSVPFTQCNVSEATQIQLVIYVVTVKITVPIPPCHSNRYCYSSMHVLVDHKSGKKPLYLFKLEKSMQL